MTTGTLIDLAKTNSKTESDYRLAKKLGISAQHINNWRKRGGIPDVVNFAKLSKAAGLTMEEALPYLGEEVQKKCILC